ncbi:MAG: P1 family peptidase, partial [Acidobacteria bacterium]|nr:P1 family peptidase [Acidobacteriota bacterium]
MVAGIAGRRGTGIRRGLTLLILLLEGLSSRAFAQGPVAQEARPRARQAGIVVGILPPGPLNAITDVQGVRVGQSTVIEDEGVRTGVTAIAPHGGNVFFDRVPAAIVVGNGFGKLLGVTQVEELG